MPRVIAPRADRDIAAILDYLTETAGSRVAGPNIRITVVRPYLILHEHLGGDETLHVLRVVHGRRNITADILK